MTKSLGKGLGALLRTGEGEKTETSNITEKKLELNRKLIDINKEIGELQGRIDEKRKSITVDIMFGRPVSKEELVELEEKAKVKREERDLLQSEMNILKSGSSDADDIKIMEGETDPGMVRRSKDIDLRMVRELMPFNDKVADQSEVAALEDDLYLEKLKMENHPSSSLNAVKMESLKIKEEVASKPASGEIMDDHQVDRIPDETDERSEVPAEEPAAETGEVPDIEIKPESVDADSEEITADSLDIPAADPAMPVIDTDPPHLEEPSDEEAGETDAADRPVAIDEYAEGTDVIVSEEGIDKDLPDSIEEIHEEINDVHEIDNIKIAESLMNPGKKPAVRRLRRVKRTISEHSPEYQRALFTTILKANEMMERGQIQDAIQVLEMIYMDNPDDDEVLYHLGNAYFITGDLETAYQHLKKATRLNPGSFRAYNNLGVILQKTGHFEEAIRSLNHALELNQKYERSWYNLGSLFMELDPPLLNEAVIFLKRAIEIDPDYQKARDKLKLCRDMQKTL
ncbi:MAG: tetratricopeptide repeat protein [Thermoplasmatota archaeon]